MARQFKPHKGLKKRIRLTKKGKVKMPRTSGRHLRSHKKSDLLRSYRRARYSDNRGIVGRVGQLLGRRVRTASAAERLGEAKAAEAAAAKE